MKRGNKILKGQTENKRYHSEPKSKYVNNYTKNKCSKHTN